MNIYDTANELGRALREAQEYKRLKEAAAKLLTDAAAETMVKDFLKQKQELELAQLAGWEPEKSKLEQVQQLYQLLSGNAVAAEYIQAFIRFQIMINDISKTIGDVVKEAAGEIQ